MLLWMSVFLKVNEHDILIDAINQSAEKLVNRTIWSKELNPFFKVNELNTLVQ